MISVIIPTCDRPIEFLLDAIRSVESQTYHPSEIIVVDNGNQPVDPQDLPEGVKLHYLAPRVGASRARNHGVALASSPYVAFLDDDDYWSKRFLERAFSVLRENGADCVYGRKDADRDGIVSHYKTMRESDISIPALLKGNPGTGGMNLLVSTEMYKRIGGFDENLQVSEDRSFALEILKCGGRIAVAPDAIAVMRVHAGERLRRSPLARLSFVWKYRDLIGPMGTISRVVSIFGKAARQKLRGR